MIQIKLKHPACRDGGSGERMLHPRDVSSQPKARTTDTLRLMPKTSISWNLFFVEIMAELWKT